MMVIMVFISQLLFCHIFRNVKENLMTSFKNELSRPNLTSENCWKKPNSLHTSMNCLCLC